MFEGIIEGLANSVKGVITSVREADYIADVQRALHDMSPGGNLLPDGFLSQSAEYLERLSQAGEGMQSAAGQAAKESVDAALALIEKLGDVL